MKYIYVMNFKKDGWRTDDKESMHELSERKLGERVTDSEVKRFK